MNKYIPFCLIVILAMFACGDSDDSPTPPPPPGGGDGDGEVVIDLTDEELLDFVQESTFQYFWQYAESNSGAARERYEVQSPNNDAHVVATGGTGFGLMALIAGIERGFISADEGTTRIGRILDFFEHADRFHGAWSHWIDGNTGHVLPFSQKDNGGDLVETAFFAQGLIAVRNYFKDGNTAQQALSQQADQLWRGIEWNWYTNGDNVLYWHWSPDYNFEIGLRIEGYNECLITYVLAASSPTHTITKDVYTQGWAKSGNIKSTASKYGYPLVVKHAGNQEYGGPLFFSHYSFLGLNPNGLADEYVNYGNAAVNHTLINYNYCIDNPRGYSGYSKNCWGLTASYSPNGYAAHSPANDLGIISPTAALSSLPYAPEESLDAMRFFYSIKHMTHGVAGFYDAYCPQNNWVKKGYLAIDQGPIVVMIENYRSQLFWRLFMNDAEMKAGLTKLGFTSPNI
ncbi:glucoamylase family protein [Dysgonomonas sp. 25]|uniref:glucoamylase family protein n=1 Tax=Dysgonomonas sp. 25 TaxID=2302933 RepID=UPI001626DAC3|nr:glucoamylase family protein [Dysgonomonas sp. 25]NDV69319.1 beta-glucosidase [Dysgonomonas sp. 25]